MHHGRVLEHEALVLTGLNLKELSWRAVPRTFMKPGVLDHSGATFRFQSRPLCGAAQRRVERSSKLQGWYLACAVAPCSETHSWGARGRKWFAAHRVVLCETGVQ